MIKSRKESKKYYRKAVKLMPAGVNSPVRAFKAVGGTPVFMEKAKGSRIYDVDGNAYIDYVLSWGPLILGHSRKEVVNAVKTAAEQGTSFGAPIQAEVELADLIIRVFPGMEMLRLVNSGTEATMSAIRLARAFTNRDKIIKFEGCYHGHSDSLLVKAGSGAITFSAPDSLGVPADLARQTVVLPYNDIDALNNFLTVNHRDIAAIILEPVCGNMGVVLPKENYLCGVRELTEKYGILLVFDEIITGFRFCFGGAQNIFKVKPDITCLGKIIGGGMPIGAYGARREIMEKIAPLGKTYQAGTLSGNPVAVACGLKTLQILKKLDYNKINRLAEKLICGIAEACRVNKVPFRLNYFGSMFTLFFSGHDVFDYKSALAADTVRYSTYFKRMLQRGIYLPPSQFEANFLSFSHAVVDINRTIKACRESLQAKERR